MKYFRILILLVMALILGSCSKDDKPPIEQVSSEKELMTFLFSKDKNDIPVTSSALIRNGAVTIFLPPGSGLTQLKPEFEVSEDAKVEIGGSEIRSGTSQIDFSNVVELVVTAADGSTKTYSVHVRTDLATIDGEVEEIMDRYSIPGLQLALVYQGRLVYRKSYGYANIENELPVSNASVFRIASISKSFTLAAILKLIEDDVLDMEDMIFGETGILGYDYGTPPYGEHVEDINLRHLVEHTAGWVNYPNDPMFSFPDLNKEELLSEVLDNRNVVNAPGSVENYSNFGYFVLGRVIEKVTGTSYEDYVKQAILEPAGITTTMVGNKDEVDKYENEVTYYDQENYSPYLIDVSRMDAPGGWVASAEDLVKYLVRVDRNPSKVDLLSSGSLDYLYLSYGTWVFNGSMAGTGSSLCRINDDLGGAVIVNTRVIPDTQMLTDINELLTQRVPLISVWPNYDLFE